MQKQIKVGGIFRYFIFFSVTALYIVTGVFANDLLDTLDYKRVSIKKGDRCIICDIPLEKSTGLALLIDGSRVTIDIDHLADFLSNKEYYLAKLQPRGALFQNSAVLTKTLRSGWFLFGTWVVLSLVMAALSCQIAIQKGYQPLRWFFTGFFLNLAGFIWILVKKPLSKQKVPTGKTKIPLTFSPVKCPECRASNHPAAEKCAICGNSLNPAVESEVKRITTAE